MTRPPAVRLRKQDIAHLLRSAAVITRCPILVIVGTGAVIVREKRLPLDLMRTREIDLYPVGVDDPDSVATLIDGTLGEGSQFDVTYGYYAHGVGERTACLPDDWRDRAVELKVPSVPETVCVCPEVNDIALAKLCAWREKDRIWLESALLNGVVKLEMMRVRAPLITNPNAPATGEITRRIEALGGGPHRRARIGRRST